MRLTSAPADLVRQVTPPAQTPQNGVVLGRGIDGFSNEEGNVKVAKADQGRDRVKNSRSLVHTHTAQAQHTRGLSPNARPSHDALPAPEPLRLRGTRATAAAKVNEDAFGIRVHGFQDLVH